MEHYSVLMSTYQKESPAFLRTAIESMLLQTVQPSEFVLVCDGTLTEELDQVIDNFGEKLSVYRRVENKGLGPSLQEGLSYCHEGIIIRMDSDDISFPDRCARELQAMKEHNADIVSGTVLEFSDESRDSNFEMQHRKLAKADIGQYDEAKTETKVEANEEAEAEEKAEVEAKAKIEARIEANEEAEEAD